MVVQGSNAPVAQYQKTKEIFSFDEKIPVYNKDIENQILLSYDENIQKNKRTQEYIIFSRFEKISGNQSAINAYKLFLEKGCSFAKEIEVLCKCGTATSYRAIENLIEMDLIRPIAPLSMRKTSGPKPILYGLHDSTSEEEQAAANRYIKSKRKTYKHVQEIKQLCLLEIIDESIQFNKIVQLARKRGNVNFHFMDVADQAAYELQQEGIRVWK